MKLIFNVCNKQGSGRRQAHVGHGISDHGNYASTKVFWAGMGWNCSFLLPALILGQQILSLGPRGNIKSGPNGPNGLNAEGPDSDR